MKKNYVVIFSFTRNMFEINEIQQLNVNNIS